jgi:hypothetical protein
MDLTTLEVDGLIVGWYFNNLGFQAKSQDTLSPVTVLFGN